MREQSQEAKEAGFEAFVDERNRADFAEWWKRFCMESGRPMNGPLREVAEIVWLAARDHPPREAKQPRCMYPGCEAFDGVQCERSCRKGISAEVNAAHEAALRKGAVLK